MEHHHCVWFPCKVDGIFAKPLFQANVCFVELVCQKEEMHDCCISKCWLNFKWWLTISDKHATLNVLSHHLNGCPAILDSSRCTDKSQNYRTSRSGFNLHSFIEGHCRHTYRHFFSCYVGHWEMLALKYLSLVLICTGKWGNSFVQHALLPVIKLVVIGRNYFGLYSGNVNIFHGQPSVRLKW